ncbi:hypothetical protein NKG05_25285 [Oerskovia sp. M15]
MSTIVPDDVTSAGRATSPREVVALAAHHDGSEVYVPGGTPPSVTSSRSGCACPGPGGPDAQVRAVWLRTVRDGEPRLSQARLEREDEHEAWYVADVLVHNPVTSYRFFLDVPGGYRWLNGRGSSTATSRTPPTSASRSTRPRRRGWVTASSTRSSRTGSRARPRRTPGRSRTGRSPRTGTTSRSRRDPVSGRSTTAGTCAGSRSISTTSRPSVWGPST